MSFFFRVLLAGLMLLGALTACDTPGKRARAHAAAFQRLSPADRQLVLHGHVRPGMSQEGVYLAWGEPDKKTFVGGGKEGATTEVWSYRQRVTLTEPPNSYDYFGPYHGYGDLPAEPWLRPGYGIGGIGNEGMLQYQPHVRSLDTLRLAEFSGGKVDRFKTAETAWSPRAHNPSTHASSSRLNVSNLADVRRRYPPVAADGHSTHRFASRPHLHGSAHRAKAASMTAPPPRYAKNGARPHRVRRSHDHRASARGTRKIQHRVAHKVGGSRAARHHPSSAQAHHPSAG